MKRITSSMPVTLLLAAFLTMPSIGHTQGEQVIMQASGTVDCSENNEVGVMSRNANLKFVGPCHAINFLGSGTTATIEHADVLIVSSRNMNLTVNSDLQELNVVNAAGSRLETKNIGTLGILASDVHVRADAITRLVYRGSNNVVTWTGSTPVIEDMTRAGSGNSFSAR